MLKTEDGLELFNVQRLAGSIQELLIDLVQIRWPTEKEISAQFQLETGEAVFELAASLFLQSEGKAQAGGVNPAAAEGVEAAVELAIEARGAQSIDPIVVTPFDEAVSFFADSPVAAARRALNPLVPIDNDLGAEGRVAGHANGDMAPLGIDDMEVVVFDVGPMFGPCELGNLPGVVAVDLPDWSGRFGAEDQKEPFESRILGEIRFGDLMLALPGFHFQPGDGMAGTIGAKPASEGSSHIAQGAIGEPLIATT